MADCTRPTPGVTTSPGVTMRAALHRRFPRQSSGRYLSLLALSLLAASGCEYFGQSKAKEAPAAPPPPVVQVVDVSPRAVPIYTEWVAQTYSQYTVDVRARVNGYIQERLFQAGDIVKQGRVLYRLDARPYQAQVVTAKGDLAQREADLQFAKDQVQVYQAQAELEQAQADMLRQQINVNRLVPLVAADAASQQSLDDARQFLAAAQANVEARRVNLEQSKISARTQIESRQGTVEAAKGTLEQAELNVSYATILAEISGRIGDTTVEVGGLATSNSTQPLTTIIPLDPISVRFNVSEIEYLDFIQSGGTRESGRQIPLRLILADGRVFPHEGRIKRVLNQVDPRTGTLQLQADFPNPEGSILAGQFGRVRARVREEKNALLIPQKAVVELQGTRSVMVVGADGKVAQRSVTMGDRVGELWIVSQGLKPGERVVVEGIQKARPGAVVNAQAVPLPALRDELPGPLFRVPAQGTGAQGPSPGTNPTPARPTAGRPEGSAAPPRPDSASGAAPAADSRPASTPRPDSRVTAPAPPAPTPADPAAAPSRARSPESRPR
jgi:membrane fusion protein, multidrug efflux system